MNAPRRRARSAACPVRRVPSKSAPGSQDEFAVGKREHRAVPHHDREVADRGRRRREKTFTDAPHGGGVLTAALEPWLEGVRLAQELHLLDPPAGLFGACEALRPRLTP